MAFILDPVLKNDCFSIGKLDLCQVLLMDNRLFPWLILVPETPGMVEIIDLPEPERMQLMHEISVVSEILKEIFAPYKLNIAALGNQVHQLHIHIIARQKNDAAWPNPVWGKAREPYSEEEKNALIGKVTKALQLS